MINGSDIAWVTLTSPCVSVRSIPTNTCFIIVLPAVESSLRVVVTGLNQQDVLTQKEI